MSLKPNSPSLTNKIVARIIQSAGARSRREGTCPIKSTYRCRYTPTPLERQMNIKCPNCGWNVLARKHSRD